MKYCLFLLILVATTSFAQDFKINTFPDSTIVKGANIANDPFQFADNPLTKLKSLKSKVTKEPVKNLHVEKKVDTIYRFKIRKDNFMVYKVDEQKNFLITANIRSKKFKTEHGIHTGMKKEQIEKILDRYHLKNIQRCLVLENDEVYQVVVFRFKKRKLSRIEFIGYLD